MRTIIIFLLSFIIGCKEPIHHPSGGYPYPENLEGIDTSFYYYPIKDIEPKDIAFGDSYQYHFYGRFNEPNISLKPLPDETLRLSFRDAFGDNIIIIARKSSLTVKRGSSDSLSYVDNSRLSQLEKEHLNILKRWYPIETAKLESRYKEYLDSMVKKYPKLLDVNYYHAIYEKKFVTTGKTFKFDSYTLPLSRQQYTSLFQQIDSSGFWQMANFTKCAEVMADGYLFTLEANTKTQYQAVSMQGCVNNKTKFTEACQNLVRLAKLDKEINLISQ